MIHASDIYLRDASSGFEASPTFVQVHIGDPAGPYEEQLCVWEKIDGSERGTLRGGDECNTFYKCLGYPGVEAR